MNRSANTTFQSVLAARLSRRGLLRGASAGLLLGAAGALRGPRATEAQPGSGFAPLVMSNEDKLLVPPGYTHAVLLRWGDPLFSATPEFDPAAQTAAKPGSSATTATS